MTNKIPKNKKGFNKLPEAVQEKISPELAQEFKSGGPAKKRGKARGGGAATKGLGYNVN